MLRRSSRPDRCRRVGLPVSASGFAAAAGVAAALVAAGCGQVERSVTRGSIRVAGSDAALAMMAAERDSFTAVYREAEIVVEGGGSLVGLEALVNRKADIAVLSREPSEEERRVAKDVGVEIALYPFARDGLGIIVRRDNPVYALSFDEVRDIFAGVTGDWAEVGGTPGPIMVYRCYEGSGTAGYVRQLVLDGADFVRSAIETKTTGEIVDSVAASAVAIGFASMAELDDRVKALPVSAKEGGPLTRLDAETVYRRTYPLTRTFYLATRGIPRENLVAGFVSYVMSNPGQKIVLDSGFIPATVPVRIKREG